MKTEAAVDQTDVLALNEQLTRELAQARQALEAMTAERDGLTRQLTQANTAHETALQSALQTAVAAHEATRQSLTEVTADRDRLAALDRDFNRRLAGQLANLGIRAEGVPSGANGQTLNLVAQYEAITDSTERATFLAAHEKELRALIR